MELSGGGHLDIVKYLLAEVDATTKAEMFKARGYAAFSLACQGGHLSIVKYLFEKVDDTTKAVMLKAGDYAGFGLACQGGYLATVEYLLSKEGRREYKSSDV